MLLFAMLISLSLYVNSFEQIVSNSATKTFGKKAVCIPINEYIFLENAFENHMCVMEEGILNEKNNNKKRVLSAHISKKCQIQSDKAL